ncbi:MAG: hypothetical protein IJ680_01380 [Paludibacteraceae bacterium]|nr:hypothetical protein [Eubacterium sp.]MBR1630484.1 hypothetical protein [Paludibacteraceae bacterium]
MTREEFTTRTGFYPSSTLYAIIEESYTEFDGSKDDFCTAYKKNADGLAEKIQHDADIANFNRQRIIDSEAAKQDAEIEKLKEQLEREQEWKLREDTNNVQQSSYEDLRDDGSTHEMSDEEAKSLLYNWFGFSPDKVKIIRTIPIFEVNRHRQLRKVGETDRRPLYNATDWNYIRFDCGRMSYELYNDDLRPYLL